MATKTLTIMEDAYEMLARRKLRDESFSDEIRRLVGEKKDNLEDCVGAWSDILTEKEMEEVEEVINKVRKASTTKALLKKLRL